MKIWRAELSDFEVYKKLFDGDEYDMLYYPQKSDIKPQKEDAKNWCEFDEETLQRFAEEMERTMPKFIETLNSFNEERIYIIEDKGKVVGFFEMLRHGAKKWKLAYCGMKNGYQKQEAFTNAIKLLLQQSGVKIVDVCAVYKSCERRMERAGFTSIGGGFYRIEAEK